MRAKYKKIKNKTDRKNYKRKLRLRSKIEGSTESPRLCFKKTNKHVLVQVVDDSLKKSLITLSTYSKAAPEGVSKNKEGLIVFAKYVSDALLQKGIKKIVFDRSYSKYTGSTKVFADKLRESGLTF